jgi:fucose 4-O-acetylase-like acetyltransferase
MSDTPSPKADRNLAFDVVKGVGILEVVVHHSLGQGARTFSEKGDWAWTMMRAIAWSTNFAIPLFLLLSAMLLAGSLAKNPGIGRFIWRRGSRTLWPYLLWTAIYLVFGALTFRTLDVDTTRLLDPERLQRAILWGKASYHLYFLVILLQLSLALPFVVLALKRVRLSFAWILAFSLLLQFGAFFAPPTRRLCSFGTSPRCWSEPGSA